VKNESKTASAGQRLMERAQAKLAEHQPVTVTTQDDATQIEIPETQLDRIERVIADLAERVARIDKRDRFKD
jgi:RAB protein geranylgeranyltransferase component A